MRTYFYGMAMIVIILITGSSCNKDANVTYPFISLKSTAGYTYSDKTVLMNDTLLIGVNAAQTDLALASFEIKRHFNTGADSSYYTETLSGNATSNYVKDFQIITRSVAGTETYTFEITDASNNKAEKTITLTVH